MKKYIIVWLLIIWTAAGCKKDFLAEKRDLTGANEEVFKDPLMADAYVNYVYFLFQHSDGGSTFTSYQANANGGFSDAYTRTTDELPGQTNWNRPWASISITQGHANQYFGQRMTTSVPNNAWTRMKQINLFLHEIDKHGMAPELTTPLKGQMYFWRAYQYFELLKLYGGVPLVLMPQDPIAEEGSTNLEVQRSSSEATLNQIVSDLDVAIEMLPGIWPSDKWGKITSGAAAALKGRALLTWASPLFNRSDDGARWQAAYDANLAAKNLLEANGFGLYSNGGFANGEAWGNMWFEQGFNPEAVIVANYNTVSEDQPQRNNGHEQAARSEEIGGEGNINPTKQMLDAFPMKDGKMINDPSGDYDYDALKFYKNRDPRFYKTFVYNGALWPYGADPNFRQWTYSWYEGDTTDNPDKYTEEDPINTGIYLRKATDPDADSDNDYEYSGTNFMELRFAEVLLNLAEAAIGSDKLGEGLQYIERVRERAGIENDDGHYGLSAADGNRDKLFAAVLHERQIELAYESKRFWDLRRWMLFNDDFGTCTRLGVQPLDGTRRTGLWIYVKTADGKKYFDEDFDPMVKKSDGTVPVIEREPDAFPPGITTMDEYLDYLYDNHFVVIEKDDIDPTSNNWKFTWFNEYYFFGLHQSILSGSPYLQQTQGWPDLNGAPGTFDPLQ